MFLIYGKQKTLSGGIDVPFYGCPFCENLNTTTFYLQSWYYHIFWVPFFPFEKEGISLCSECGAKRTEAQFGPKLKEEYKTFRRYLKHPWWTYTIAVLLLLVVSAIIIAVSI